VLEFLQEKFAPGAPATTLRVYVAAIAAHRESDEIPLGKLRLVSAFMHGVRRLKPARSPGVPSWDLSVVLEGLKVVSAISGPNINDHIHLIFPNDLLAARPISRLSKKRFSVGSLGSEICTQRQMGTTTTQNACFCACARRLHAKSEPKKKPARLSTDQIQ
jgi:hypothetical protein